MKFYYRVGVLAEEGSLVVFVNKGGLEFEE